MVVLQSFVKTAAIGGIAFFWANFTLESLKMVCHIILSEEKPQKPITKAVISPKEKPRKPITKAPKEKPWKIPITKAVCGNCQELYGDDEYDLIHDIHLCEACR